MSLIRIATIGAFVSASSLAEACSYVFSSKWADKPIEIENDCSFASAEERDGHFLSGGPAVNIQGGRVGHRLYSWDICNEDEQLLMVDCKSLETIKIDGRENPEFAGTVSPRQTRVDYLYPPHGEIRVTAKTKISDLVKTAEKYRYTYDTGIAEWLLGMKTKNRFNPFCGCKLFYPDSAGARS